MVIHDCRDFGAALRMRRKQRGYTQQRLSELTGLSVSFISDLERGKETAELGKAMLLMNLLALDCTLRARESS